MAKSIEVKPPADIAYKITFSILKQFNNETIKSAVFVGVRLSLSGVFPYPGREGVMSRYLFVLHPL